MQCKLLTAGQQFALHHYPTSTRSTPCFLPPHRAPLLVLLAIPQLALYAHISLTSDRMLPANPAREAIVPPVPRHQRGWSAGTPRLVIAPAPASVPAIDRASKNRAPATSPIMPQAWSASATKICNCRDL